VISEIARIISFTFRLFGNIFAGEVVLFMAAFLVPFLAATVFYGLEVFVGFIQAFVFAMLTLVFAVTAVSHGEHGHDAEEAEENAGH
jgi:F-type H+-transporting ATPase subunit a